MRQIPERVLADIIAHEQRRHVHETDDVDSRGSASLDLILGRVQALEKDGRLIAEGEITRPRYSEVKLP